MPRKKKEKASLLPAFSMGLALPWPRSHLRIVLPFNRSWIWITVFAIIGAVMTGPALSVGYQAIETWSKLESLFDLTIAIFSSAWVLGWSIGLIFIYIPLILMLFGREVVLVRPDLIEIRIDVGCLGIGGSYDPAKIRNLRSQEFKPDSGVSWRGEHLAFDYGNKTVEFGSHINSAQAQTLITRIEHALGHPLRKGEALPEELVITKPEDIKPPGSTVVSHAPAGSPLTLTSPSTLALIVANLAPVFGTVFLGWNLGDVMVLYWAESGVIGIYNILKMAVIERWLVLLTGLFFLSHYGAFMSIHFMFIYYIFVTGPGSMNSDSPAEVARMFIELWPALAALFISHGISFFTNFLGRREYIGKTLKDQMSEPYTRIIIMQMVIIFGGWIVLLFGNPVPVLLVLIAMKISADVRAHLQQRVTTTTTGAGATGHD